MSDVQSPDAPEPAVLPLLGPAEIRELAASAGIRPTKTLGQNFVIDPNTIRRIVAAARLEAAHDDGPVDTVLEVGPGLGSLTLGLLDAVEHVVAVEIDPPLAAQLPHTVARFRPEAADRLEVVLEDALQVASLPREPEALVANLPYNVAVPVLLNLLARFPSIRQGLVMVQDEVADQLAQAGTCRRDDHVRQEWADECAEADQQGVDLAEELRVNVLGNGAQRLGCDSVALRAHDAVHEVHGEADAFVVAKQFRELLGGGVVGICFGGSFHPVVGAGDGSLDDGVEVVGIGRRNLVGAELWHLCSLSLKIDQCDKE